MTDRYLTISDLSKMVQRSKSWIRSRLDQIPHFRLGIELRFRESEIHKWMESYRVVGAKNPYVELVLERLAEKFDGSESQIR
jgi:predicted DNA-binding transcriptional regulator AlpA